LATTCHTALRRGGGGGGALGPLPRQLAALRCAGPGSVRAALLSVTVPLQDDGQAGRRPRGRRGAPMGTRGALRRAEMRPWRACSACMCARRWWKPTNSSRETLPSRSTSASRSAALMVRPAATGGTCVWKGRVRGG
jgi:hypothetical protein